MSGDMRNCDVERRKYFFLAVNTGLVIDALPDERCRTFYRERSGPEVYCAIVGNVVIPSGSPSNNVCSFISDSPTWKDLASAITEQGTIAGIQLSSTWEGYKGIRKFASTAGGITGYVDAAQSISRKQIIQTLDGLERGTEHAVNAGYRHIQLHAAHGYLFNLLLDYRFSPMLDFVARHIERWASELHKIGVETSLRVSFGTGDKEYDLVDGGRALDSMVSYSVDYIDLSHGFYNVDKRLIYPSTPKILAERSKINLAVAKKYPDKNFILSGKSALAWESVLPNNINIGICRDLIANPDFIKTRQNGCANCMTCHYFSLGRSDLNCGRWKQ
jgi:NADPH2 dehydrogenase